MACPRLPSQSCLRRWRKRLKPGGRAGPAKRGGIARSQAAPCVVEAGEAYTWGPFAARTETEPGCPTRVKVLAGPGPRTSEAEPAGGPASFLSGAGPHSSRGVSGRFWRGTRAFLQGSQPHPRTSPQGPDSAYCPLDPSLKPSEGRAGGLDPRALLGAGQLCPDPLTCGGTGRGGVGTAKTPSPGVEAWTPASRPSNGRRVLRPRLAEPVQNPPLTTAQGDSPACHGVSTKLPAGCTKLPAGCMRSRGRRLSFPLALPPKPGDRSTFANSCKHSRLQGPHHTCTGGKGRRRFVRVERPVRPRLVCLPETRDVLSLTGRSPSCWHCPCCPARGRSRPHITRRAGCCRGLDYVLGAALSPRCLLCRPPSPALRRTPGLGGVQRRVPGCPAGGARAGPSPGDACEHLGCLFLMERFSFLCPHVLVGWNVVVFQTRSHVQRGPRAGRTSLRLPVDAGGSCGLSSRRL